MRHLRSLSLVLALATAASAASAQAPVPSPAPSPAHKSFLFGMTANAMDIAPAAASSQMVGTRSWGMQFDGGVTFARYLFAGLDFGPQILSDKASFTQTTTAGDMKSNAMLMYYSAMAGARSAPVRVIPGLAAASLGVYGGASGTSGKRSIDKCVDCFSENISIAGGSFVQPTLVFGEGTTRLRVSDRYYTGGTGMRSVISLGMELGGR